MSHALSTIFHPNYLPGGATMVELPKPAVAKMANYSAARPTSTTTVGNYIGTNPNQPLSLIQTVGMAFTSEMVAKDGGVGWTYLLVRGNYCEPIQWKPNTGDDGLNRALSEYLILQFQDMGVDCSMFDAVGRTLHLEMPIRGDAGLIFHRDEMGKIRLMEFSADMLGEPFQFVNPRTCGLATDAEGNIREVPGNNFVYYAGRYFKGCNCVAYKIYQRTAAGWWANPVIYSAQDVIYVKDPRNFRSMRGVTTFAQVLKYMQKSEALLQSALSIAQRQALTFGRVFNNMGAPIGGNVVYEGEGFNWNDCVQTFFEKVPGGPLEEYRFNGDSAEFTNPTAPGAPVIEGVRKTDEKICNGLGMTYGFVIAYDQIGGAPSRLDVNRNTKEIERIINRIAKPVLNRIVSVLIEDAVDKGIFHPNPNILKGEWMFTTLPTADAFKDSKEDVMSVRAGQDSISQIVSRYNRTFPDIMRDRKEENITAYTMLDQTNRELERRGIKERATIADFVQVSDNPQQAAIGQTIDQTGEQPKVTAPDQNSLAEK